MLCGPPVVVFVLALLSAQVACSSRSLDYLQSGPGRDAGADRQPESDHDGSVKNTSRLDTYPNVGPPDGAKEDVAKLDASTWGSDATVERDAPVPDGQDSVRDTTASVDRSDSPLDGALSPKDSPTAVFDTGALGSDGMSPLRDGSVPVFDARKSDGPSVHDTAVLLPDAAAWEIAPDLAGTPWDVSVDLPPDLVRDSGSADASTQSAEIYFRKGNVNSGATYADAFDLGNEPNRLLVVALAWDSTVAPPVITYAGSLMALVEGDTVNSQTLAVYYLVGPPADRGTLIVTFPSTVNLSAISLGLRNVSSTPPVIAQGMTSADWAALIGGGSILYNGSLALVYGIATTGNNEIPTVTGAPHSYTQIVPGRPTSPYLSVGAGYIPTAGYYNWTFSYANSHWQGIAMLEIRSSL